MASVTLYNLGTAGIHKDIPSHLLGPDVWSDGKNVRNIDGFNRRFQGHAAVFDPPEVVPGFVMNVPAISDSFWLYASLTKVYGYSGGTHTDITRAAGGNYTAAAYRDWNGCLLAGVPILNNGADVPQYWSNLALGTDLAALPNWTSTLRAKVLRNYGRFLVALNLNDNSTLLPHAVQWSHPADPGSVPASWDLTDATRDCGRTHLTDSKGGVIVDGRLLGNNLIIYKENSYHIMRFIGGQEIMGFDMLQEEGIVGHRCVAVIDSGNRHFGLGQNNVFMHSGTRAIDYPLDMKSRRTLYSEIDTTNKLNSFVLDNPFYEEVLLCYPTTGRTYPNKALVYNYRKDSVSFRDISALAGDTGRYTDSLGPTWATVTGTWDSITGPWQLAGDRRLILASPEDVKLYGFDSGTTFGAAVNTTAFLQRTGLAIVGKDQRGQPKADYQRRKLAPRIWPKIKGTANVQVRMGAQEALEGPNAAINWSPYQTYNPTQRYLDFEVNGRFLAVEFTSSSDIDWQLDGYDLRFELLGEN